jgi:hypothetical protein
VPQDAAITWIATFDPPVSEAIFNYSGNAYLYAPGGTVNCYNSTPNSQCYSATTAFQYNFDFRSYNASMDTSAAPGFTPTYNSLKPNQMVCV